MNQQKLIWKDEYSVSSKFLDQQHRKLLEIVNEFNGAIVHQSGGRFAHNTLNLLVRYAEEHFRDEEQLMQMGGYPKELFDEHVREHENLTEEIFLQCRNLQTYGDESLPIIGEFLRKWLIDHILSVDIKYRGYVANIDDSFLEFS